MRILCVTTTFPRHEGDTMPRFVLDLSAQMVQRGHHVRVLTPHAPGAARLENWQGMEIHRYRYLWPESAQTLSNQALHAALGSSWLSRFKAIPFVGMLLFNLQLEVMRFRPDLIHCHWLIPQGTFCAIVGKLNRVPVIVSLHGSDVFKYQNKIVDKVRQWTMKNVRMSVANSSAVLRRVESIQGRPTSEMSTPIIPMGVDTQMFHPTKETLEVRKRLSAESSPLILAVGRLSPEKGFCYLLEAFSLLIQQFPKITLAIAGYGPCEKELKELAQALNISHAVCWLGPLGREELAPLYASADVFVSPSIRTPGGPEEALGLVYLEAMASGTVPVGTSIGGIPDIIQHGKNGMLAVEKDALDLARQITWLLQDPVRRKNLSNAAIETARKHFSWPSVGSRYNELYAQIGASKAA